MEKEAAEASFLELVQWSRGGREALTRCMKQRLSLPRIDPAAYAAFLQLEKYLAESPLEPRHKHLIKLRASQLNGCAYCVDMHVREALRDGEDARRLHALVVWRDTPFFDERERALLALTEEVTKIEGRVSDETYELAERVLGEGYLAAVLMAAITINAWNRLGIATEMQPALST